MWEEVTAYSIAYKRFQVQETPVLKIVGDEKDPWLEN